MQEISGEYQPLRRAQALQGGDGAQPRRQETGNGVTDTDAAHQKRGESDQAHELRQPVEPEAQAAAGVGQAAHPPTGVGIVTLDGVDGGDVRCAGWQKQAVLPGEQAARLHQTRFDEGGERHHQARTEACEGVEAAIGFAGDHGADLDRRFAHLHTVAEGDVHAPQRRLLDDGAPQAVALGQRIGKRSAAAQLDRAIQRIARFDGLELDQRGMAVGLDRSRHGAAVDPTHELALRAQERHLLRACLAIEQRNSDIAAHDLAGVGV